MCRSRDVKQPNGNTNFPFWSTTTRYISKYYNSFKAAEWSNFPLFYLIPFLYERLPEKYFNYWRKLVKVWRDVCLQLSGRYWSTGRIMQDPGVCARVLYFRRRRDRFQLRKSNTCSLVHLADSLRDLGPGYVWWVFPTVRFNGVVEGKSKSMVRIRSYNI